MAVSKELKAYINRKYEDRITEINNRKAEALRIAKADHEATQKEISETLTETTVSAMQEHMNILKDKGFSIGYDGKSFMKKGIFALMVIPPFQENVKVTKIYNRQIELVRLEQEKLLIVLSLEKNFDSINEVLKKYDIAF